MPKEVAVIEEIAMGLCVGFKDGVAGRFGRRKWSEGCVA